MPYKRTSFMSSYPTRYNRPPAMAGLGYVSAQEDLGDTLTMPASGDLSVARLQAAINRVVMNARNDLELPSFSRDAARAAVLVPLQIDGVASMNTRVAAASAGLIAGATMIEVTNAAFTEKLEAFADSRGYPQGPIVVEPGIIGKIPLVNKLSHRTALLVLGGGAALALTFFLLRRRSP